MLEAALFLHRPSHYDTHRRCSSTLKCVVMALCGNLDCIHIKCHGLFHFEMEIRQIGQLVCFIQIRCISESAVGSLIESCYFLQSSGRPF